jgi:hypothetical protein
LCHVQDLHIYATEVIASFNAKRLREKMPKDLQLLEEVPSLYRIIKLDIFRRTPGVSFDNVPMAALPRIDAIDRVIHEKEAVSPGPVGTVERPWYMHPHQDDNLIVLYGTRYVDIYTKKHGKVESFVVMPDEIRKNGKIIHQGPTMLVWPRGVFHRIRSGREGSASLNFAVHHAGIDMRTNFNIYALDTESGKFSVLREGHIDQV